MNNQNELFIKARMLEDEGRFDLAAKQYEKAIKLKIGDQAMAHQGRGRALARLGCFEEALDECQNALKLNPELHLAHSVLGYIYTQQSKYDAAENELLTALDLKSDDVTDLINLANLYSILECYEEEIAMCEKVIQHQPDNLEIQNILVRLYLNQARFREAIKHLNELCAARPGDLRVYPYYAALIMDVILHYFRLNSATGIVLFVGALLLASLTPSFINLPIGIVFSIFVLISTFVYLWFYTSRYRGKGFIILQLLVFYFLLCAVYWSIVFLVRPRLTAWWLSFD